MTEGYLHSSQDLLKLYSYRTLEDLGYNVNILQSYITLEDLGYNVNILQSYITLEDVGYNVNILQSYITLEDVRIFTLQPRSSKVIYD
jgi:hypothetical protein